MAEITITDLRQRHIEDWLAARRDVRAGKANLTPQGFSTALVGFATTLAKKQIEGEEFRAALDSFVRGLLAMQEQREALSAYEENGVRVRAAARCGWFDELDEGAVGDLQPWEVDQLSDAVTDAFNEAVTVPKN